ncbi:sigma-54-dependent transcriptional regulator [Methylomonas methanica]|uniref:Two component, sigma54 specific, transcriptional regulator, Fis family n=1 Tax=Methylomonas methanica (strain DSM 25384 / MC09) TaxID=857087 RepID=G0A356_METMM|nr:sigma-54 dependent transcriptional regulator [Methylomonas methanica]AEF98988.1 two component, sigma54 specific, transcriptional regulator, Fis family [Methylomonas methanica MC09]
MNMPVTLVVDDEPDIRELLDITLSRMNIRACCVETIKEARQLLDSQHFDLCLTDMRLPDGDGLSLVEYIQESGLQLPVAVITAHGSMDIAVSAMKKGAFDFLSKPVDLAALRQLVGNALQVSPNHSLEKDRRTRDTLLGESELMCEIRSKIQKVARNQAPIYISGESGSGKELVAKLIHQQGPRADKSFVAINCGAIPHELMESEFFGHKKGSFSGAIADKQGLFQAADGGTLFLDEVADLPLSLQVKLLRAIQEKKIRPVGEQHEVSVDVRLLSATHKDLAKMVQEGSFRQDLYYRINVIELSLPPLRVRAADIVQIAEHLLERLAKANQVPVPQFSRQALIALQQYSFPGNVRELENILERALALHEGDKIDVDDLNLQMTCDEAAKPHGDYNAEQMSLENYLEDVEKKALTAALEENRWNKTAAAKQLGMTFRSFRYRLKKLGLE